MIGKQGTGLAPVHRAPIIIDRIRRTGRGEDGLWGNAPGEEDGGKIGPWEDMDGGEREWISIKVP